MVSPGNGCRFLGCLACTVAFVRAWTGCSAKASLLDVGSQLTKQRFTHRVKNDFATIECVLACIAASTVTHHRKSFFLA